VRTGILRWFPAGGKPKRRGREQHDHDRMIMTGVTRSAVPVSYTAVRIRLRERPLSVVGKEAATISSPIAITRDSMYLVEVENLQVTEHSMQPDIARIVTMNRPLLFSLSVVIYSSTYGYTTARTEQLRRKYPRDMRECVRAARRVNSRTSACMELAASLNTTSVQLRGRTMPVSDNRAQLSRA
jgi:hypothetical protein